MPQGVDDGRNPAYLGAVVGTYPGPTGTITVREYAPSGCLAAVGPDGRIIAVIAGSDAADFRARERALKLATARVRARSGDWDRA